MNELRDRLQAALGEGYRVGEELTGGGMSRVFVAEDVELGRKVVVKLLPPDLAAGLRSTLRRSRRGHSFSSTSRTAPSTAPNSSPTAASFTSPSASTKPISGW
ncbi:MAG: hypothetical protein H0W42_09405 [Gemmatimonadaceae bacterium]|nr:hypothetical protein [Gemmatimonadaceae bacterium]